MKNIILLLEQYLANPSRYNLQLVFNEGARLEELASETANTNSEQAGNDEKYKCLIPLLESAARNTSIDTFRLIHDPKGHPEHLYKFLISKKELQNLNKIIKNEISNKKMRAALVTVFNWYIDLQSQANIITDEQASMLSLLYSLSKHLKAEVQSTSKENNRILQNLARNIQTSKFTNANKLAAIDDFENLLNSDLVKNSKCSTTKLYLYNIGLILISLFTAPIYLYLTQKSRNSFWYQPQSDLQITVSRVLEQLKSMQTNELDASQEARLTND